MNEIVYWCSKYNDPHCYVVIELIATQICRRSGILQGSFSCGWSFLCLGDEGEETRSTPIYEGTPRKLLYISSDGIEGLRDTIPQSDAFLQYSFIVVPGTARKCIQDDHIISAQEAIPGIDFLPYNVTLQGSELHELNLQRFSVVFESRECFEKDLIASLVGGTAITASKKKATFLHFAKKQKKKSLQQEVHVVYRRMNFTVHNSHVTCFAADVDLQLDGSDRLFYEGPLRLEHYFKHHLCALVCSLEYIVYIPPAKPSAEAKYSKVVVGSQLYIPFSDTGMKLYNSDDRKVVILPLTKYKKYRSILSSQDACYPELRYSGDVSIEFELSSSDETTENFGSAKDTDDKKIDSKTTDEKIDPLNAPLPVPIEKDTPQVVIECDINEPKSNCGKLQDEEGDYLVEEQKCPEQGSVEDPPQEIDGPEVRSEAKSISTPVSESPIAAFNGRISLPGSTIIQMEEVKNIPGTMTSESKAIPPESPDSVKELKESLPSTREHMEPKHQNVNDFIGSQLREKDVVGCKVCLRLGSAHFTSNEESVYCTFQFYDNPGCKSESIQNGGTGNRVLSSHDFQQQFSEEEDSKKDFLHYLEARTMHIDIWSVRSAMNMGTVSVPLKICLGDTLKPFPVLETSGIIGESGRLCLSSRSVTCGNIEVGLSIEAIRNVKEFTNLFNGAATPVPYAKILVGTSDSNHGLKHFIRMAKEAVSMKRDTSRGEATKGKSSVVAAHDVHDCDPFSMDPSGRFHSNNMDFFLSLLAKSYQGRRFQENMIESLIVDWYRQEMKSIFIQRHLEDQCTHRRNLSVLFGQALYLELIVNNTNHLRTQFSLSFDDPHLRVIIDDTEAEHIRSALPPVIIGDELGIRPLAIPQETSTGSYNFWINAGECITIPLVLQVATLNLNAKDVVMKVKDLSNGYQQARYCLYVKVRPPIVDRVFHLIGKIGSTLSRTITSDESFADRTMRCISSNSEQVTCDTRSGITVRARCGDAHATNDFHLLCYDNSYMIGPYTFWQFSLSGYEKVDVQTKAKQWQSVRLLIDIDNLTRTQYQFHTSDEEHCILNPSVLRPIFGALNEIKVSFNFGGKGVYKFIVHMAADHRLIRGWIFEVKVIE